MPSTLDCVLCIFRQALEAARFASGDEKICRRVLEGSMRLALEAGDEIDPPRIGTKVHRLARELSGDPDPYLREKKKFNRAALERWDDCQRWIREAENPFDMTVRLAIAGNSIDFALESISEDAVDEAIRRAIDQPLQGSLDEFLEAIRESEKILYLTDNAGEIVYDRLLVERLVSPEFGKDVTVATRGKPIINDALLEDARETGMTDVARVVDNGGDGLGVIFELTSEEFREEFRKADLIIAKGLANFESLGTSRTGDPLPKRIAFLFKAKCPFIAQSVGAKVGDLIVRVRK